MMVIKDGEAVLEASVGKRKRQETPNSTINVKPLPTEIIQAILNHLEEDKYTLGQCMQVSLTFNSTAAPLLYRIITIEPNASLPYEIAPKPPANLQRLTSDKVANLKYIDVVTFRDGDEDCENSVHEPEAVFTLSVSTLRVYRDHDPDERFDLPRGRCKCAEYLRPKKIIYLDTLSQHVMHLDRILHNKPKVETITTLFRRESAPESLRYDYTGHIVTVCLTIGIASQLIFIFPPYSPHCADTRLYYRSIWTGLRELMFQAAVMNGSPDFVVVNIESIAAEPYWEQTKRETRRSRLRQQPLKKHIRGIGLHLSRLKRANLGPVNSSSFRFKRTLSNTTGKVNSPTRRSEVIWMRGRGTRRGRSEFCQ